MTLKKILILLFIFTILIGCQSPKEDDTNTTTNNQIDNTDNNNTDNNNTDNNSSDDIQGIHIISAVYANYNTTDTTNDKLYIYFDRYFDGETIYNIDAFTFFGEGELGSSTSVAYEVNNKFALEELNIDNTGTMSKEFNTSNDQVSITMNQLTDSNGKYPITNPKVTIEKFNVFPNLKTGDNNYKCVNDANTSTLIDCNYTFIDNNNTSDANVTRSDGYNSKTIGINRHFTLNNSIISDLDTGLLWENNSSYGTYIEADDYCNNLVLDGYSNWRIPNINELISITNKNAYEPAIFSIFNQTQNYPYYTSTQNVNNNKSVWAINFFIGNDLVVDKNTSNFVRCVHNKD